MRVLGIYGVDDVECTLKCQSPGKSLIYKVPGANHESITYFYCVHRLEERTNRLPIDGLDWVTKLRIKSPKLYTRTDPTACRKPFLSHSSNP